MPRGYPKTTKQFIIDAIRVHGDKFDYSEVKYVDNKTHINIYCKKCKNFFSQRPKHHIDKVNGCPNCKKWDTNRLISESKRLHGENTFDYSKTVYNGMNSKSIFICKECKEELNIKAANHIHLLNGCRFCNVYKSEKMCRQILENFLHEKFRPKCPKFLGRLELDCYNEILSLGLEYNGRQHYEFVDYWHKTEEEFKKSQERDQLKYKLCKENNVKLIIVPYQFTYKKQKELETFIRDQLILLGYLANLEFID